MSVHGKIHNKTQGRERRIERETHARKKKKSRRLPLQFSPPSRATAASTQRATQRTPFCLLLLNERTNELLIIIIMKRRTLCVYSLPWKQDLTQGLYKNFLPFHFIEDDDDDNDNETETDGRADVDTFRRLSHHWIKWWPPLSMVWSILLLRTLHWDDVIISQSHTSQSSYDFKLSEPVDTFIFCYFISMQCN